MFLICGRLEHAGYLSSVQPVSGTLLVRFRPRVGVVSAPGEALGRMASLAVLSWRKDEEGPRGLSFLSFPPLPPILHHIPPPLPTSRIFGLLVYCIHVLGIKTAHAILGSIGYNIQNVSFPCCYHTSMAVNSFLSALWMDKTLVATKEYVLVIEGSVPPIEK